ncbi:sensor histidine kinase [Kribbella sp. NBC_01510]|uniref:sensor histidine kinase n=1 Tax=Kribbella sp. NBC_01510 TaxID=2903581 RepID=UPI00386D31DF
MQAESRIEPWAASPVWFRQPGKLHAGTAVLIALSASVELVRMITDGAGPVAFAALLITVAGAALARRRPWPGLVVTVAGGLISALAGWDPIVMWSIAVFVLFSFTLQGMPAVRGTVFVGAGLYLMTAIAQDYDFLSLQSFPAVVSAVAGGAIGNAIRIHQEYWHSLEERAADAVATRDLEATRRVAEERLRIARDLHDVVGHQVAVMSMHLGVAEVNLPPDAESARTALDAARTAVRSVLLETQRILEVLRRGTDDASTAEPAPELSRLPELVESYRQIGLHVDATVDEVPATVDPAVSLTAYRIVQEALTNAHRHGDGTATLRLRTEEGRILIEVVNPRRPGDASPSVGSGYGLVGIRERVESAGGRLEVADANGSFRLSVVLAVDGSDLP